MLIANKEIPVAAILQFGALVAMLSGALTWADSRYLLADNFKSFAVQQQRDTLESKIILIRNSIRDAKKNNETGLAFELETQLKLQEQRLKSLPIK